MPIIQSCRETDEGATPWRDSYKDAPTIYVRKTYVGACISESERNGYHDSDFYMLVWDEATNAPKSIEFASTRGYCAWAFGSHVDATPEVLAKFKAWQAEQEAKRRREQRSAKAKALLSVRAAFREISAAHGVSYAKLLKLRHVIEPARLLPLFNPRIRSDFKKRMRDQVVAWLKDPAPRYATPLSRKQIACLETAAETQARYRPTRYNRSYY